jgi:hypothetical protein
LGDAFRDLVGWALAHHSSNCVFATVG